MKIDKKKLNHLNSHSHSLNRRQFVGLGLAGAASTMLVPSGLGMLFNSPAFAEASAAKRIAFIGFDLAGGAAMPGNFLVGKAGGPEDLLSGYNLLGWNPRVSGWDSRFGLPMAKADVSMMFKGMTETMSPEAQRRFKMGSLNHVSRDDTTDNPLSILELLAWSQSTQFPGSKTSAPLGRTPNSSGGNSRSVKVVPQFSSMKVGNLTDLLNLSALTPTLANLGEKRVPKLLETVMRLSKLQSSRYLGSGPSHDLVSSSYNGIPSLVGDAISLDPRKAADASKVYQLTPESSPLDEKVIRGGIVNAALTGMTGPAVLTIGGCDYHDSTSTTGDAKDLEIGREIGRAVELAHLKQVPLFIHIFTDGGVGAISNSRVWNSDSGDKSLSVIGFYDPTGKASYRSPTSMQIGHFTDGQGADRETLIGSNPSLAAHAVFANFLNLSGQLGEIDQYVPKLFTTAQLESVLVFN